MLHLRLWVKYNVHKSYPVYVSQFYNQGGKILLGGSVIESEGNFVQPTIVEISPSAAVVKEELFCPILYVMKFQVGLSGLF